MNIALFLTLEFGNSAYIACYYIAKLQLSFLVAMSEVLNFAPTYIFLSFFVIYCFSSINEFNVAVLL